MQPTLILADAATQSQEPQDPEQQIDAAADQAGDTVGNAEETADWIRAEGYQSLLLVTSDYHMARSLVEFRRRLPGVEIVPHPVSSARVHLEEWWQWPGTAILLATEYSKFLVSMLRSLVYHHLG